MRRKAVSDAMAILRRADPAADYSAAVELNDRFGQLLRTLPTNPDARTQHPKRRLYARPLFTLVPAAVLVLALVVFTGLWKPHGRTHVGLPASQLPVVNIDVKMDGTAIDVDQHVSLERGESYQFMLRFAGPATSQLSGIQIVVTGPRSGIAGGHPIGEYVLLGSRTSVEERSNVVVNWTATPVARSSQLALSVVYFVSASGRRSAVERSLCYLDVR